MRKLLSTGVVALGLLATAAVPAFAYDGIADVSKDYWAQKEIADVVASDVMTLDASTNFYPEEVVTRVEFVKSLLKLLANDNMEIKIQNSFKDVSSSDPDYGAILRSQQLGLVYGYPNKTFQPSKVLIRSEAQSVVSHITREKVTDTSILSNFIDANKVPGWAKYVYAKTLTDGIYVNYPNANELRPDDALTRAEAAVLLSRLKSKIGLVKQQYVSEDVVRVEHLNVSRKAESNEVKITNMRKIIVKGNVLEVAFDEKFKSKNHAAGDTLYFVANEDICTDEGTVVIPAGSKFFATVDEIVAPKWFNKNARVFLHLDRVIFPNGSQYKLVANPFYKNYELKEGPWMTAGKVLLSTATLGAIGTGAGVGFAFIPEPVKVGTGVAIGLPVGAGIGLVTGLVTPGLNYNAKEGEEIYVILLEDASVK